MPLLRSLSPDPQEDLTRSNDRLSPPDSALQERTFSWISFRGMFCKRTNKKRLATIFDPLHPEYQILRDHNNILSASEAICQQWKLIVDSSDARLGKLLKGLYMPTRDLTTSVLRLRVIARTEVRDHTRHRPFLIEDLRHSHQIWASLHDPTITEERKLRQKLEKEVKVYKKLLKIRKVMGQRGGIGHNRLPHARSLDDVSSPVLENVSDTEFNPVEDAWKAVSELIMQSIVPGDMSSAWSRMVKESPKQDTMPLSRRKPGQPKRRTWSSKRSTEQSERSANLSSA